MRRPAILSGLTATLALPLAFGTVAALSPTEARADDVLASATALDLTGWTTASHLGFGISDQSTLGFRQVGGSLVFLDVEHPLGHDFAVGLRTSGEGGRLPAEQFYRIGAGPLMTWNVVGDWQAQVALSIFEESGLRPDGGHLYRSRGTSELFGWEHKSELAPRVAGAWGVFVSRHQGNVTQETAGPSPVAAATVNDGLTHGLELSLEIQL